MCMIAATIPDVDGLGILFGQAAYERWHHVAGHGLPFCLVVCALMTAFTRRKPLQRVLLLVLLTACFHLHLLMDYHGSGPGWPIVYFWPLSDFKFVNWDSWELSSWQNQLTALVLLLVTVLIGWRRRRTPLEVLMPSLDAKFVGRRLAGETATRSFTE